MNLYYPDIRYHCNLVLVIEKSFQEVFPVPQQFHMLLQTKQNFYSFSHQQTLSFAA